MLLRINLFILLLPCFAFGQQQFSDNFSDNNFTANPAWVGNTAFYIVNTAGALQINDSLSNSRYLSTPSTISLEAEWNFTASMEFNPSSSNYCEVYLCADSANLKNATSAFFVRLGGSTADKISLYRRNGSSNTLIAESTDAWVGRSKNKVRVRVTRNISSLFTLFADTTTAFTGFTQLNAATDSTFITSNFTGVRSIFTVTRSKLISFDDFNYTGKAYVDNDAPVLNAFVVNANDAIELRFSEPLDKASAQLKTNYFFNTTPFKVDEAQLDSVSLTSVFLTIDPPLANKAIYTLNIKNVEDGANNSMRDTAITFTYAIPEKGDVVLNELLPDPLPVIGFPPNALPASEYIELYNRTNFDFDVTGWSIKTGSTTKILGEAILPADSFLILARAEALTSFLPSANALAVPFSATALTNGGTSVTLFGPKGNVLDAITYAISWYGDANKEDGGWSLERLDPNNLCGGAENWAASKNIIGGTPGFTNSVRANTVDSIAPKNIRVSVSGDSSITIFYSELLDDAQLLDPFGYAITPSLDIDFITANPSAQAYEIKFLNALQAGVIYSIRYTLNTTDCAGNPLQFNPLVFGKAQQPKRGELVLNEILFNPFTGGVDYVELYNRSDKLFDLSKLRLGNYLEGTVQIDAISELTDGSFLLLPNTYLCLTENPQGVIPFYTIKNLDAIVEVKDVPSLPDKEGSIILLNANLSVVDSLFYSADLLSPALRDENGVSLERVRYDDVSVTTAWYSASSLAGFGTPGYKNSQSAGVVNRRNETLSFASKLFSPNNDGYQDKLEINYAFDKPNYVATLSIYNKAGQRLSTFINAQVLAAEGALTWDGTNDAGGALRKDAYLLVLEYFHTDGEQGTEKYAIVLTR